ncbi:hypothetical protein CC85DRAFT_287823, partial [Cutaneotrichosporon oleaginosum]
MTIVQPHPPTTSPAPKGACRPALDPAVCTLDTKAHPAILKRLIALSPHAGKLAFRAASRTSRDLADAALFAHAVIVQWGSAGCYAKPPTSLFALLSPAGDVLPGKPLAANNAAWARRLAHTRVLDSTVRLPSFQWETVVHAWPQDLGRPRVLRRLVAGGLWRGAPPTVVDLVVLSPLSLASSLGQDMLTAALTASPRKHVINVLVDASYRGAFFPTGSAGEACRNTAVLIFAPLPHGALRRHLTYPGDDTPVPSRIMNLTSATEDIFDSLAAIVSSGVYTSYLFVGLHELDPQLLGLGGGGGGGDGGLELFAGVLKSRILDVVRERHSRSSALGLAHVSAASLENSLALLSHAEYRAAVGDGTYTIETWPQAPAPWWV